MRQAVRVSAVNDAASYDFIATGAGIHIPLGYLYTPHLLSVLIGSHVMKLHPDIALGVCAGAGTSGPAPAAIQEVADSKIPTLGYGVLSATSCSRSGAR